MAENTLEFFRVKFCREMTQFYFLLGSIRDLPRIRNFNFKKKRENREKNFGKKLKFWAHSGGWIVPKIFFDLFSVTLYG